MEIILLLCAVVIALCIFTNRFTTKIGIPAVLTGIFCIIVIKQE